MVCCCIETWLYLPHFHWIWQWNQQAVVLRSVAKSGTAASDLQHCWTCVCLPARQCTNTLCLWHGRASVPWGIPLIMATLCNRAGHYIIALWFLSSIFFFLFLFLAYSQRPQVGCLPYFDAWCGPSVNLECRSERCCTRLAANAGPKKVAKNRHLGTIPQLCRAISSQLRHVSTIGKKTC